MFLLAFLLMAGMEFCVVVGFEYWIPAFAGMTQGGEWIVGVGFVGGQEHLSASTQKGGTLFLFW